MIVLPRSTSDPTGQDKRERGAIDQFERRYKQIEVEIMALLKAVKVKKTTLFSPLVTNADVVKYEFEVDTIQLELIGQQVDDIVDRWLEVKGDASEQWMISGYVTPAYQQGTGIVLANLSAQSAAYKATRESLTQLLMTDTYRRRLGFVQARAFESMKGLTSYSKERIRTALVDGMAQGVNPLDVARHISEATGASLSRARTIARTEITTAMRRSRIEEAEQAAVDLDLRIMMMQMSALSATTRLSHARRHGKLFTFEQARLWMSTSPNMINCKCTFVEVVVGKDGKPLAKGVLARAKAMFDKSAFAGQ